MILPVSLAQIRKTVFTLLYNLFTGISSELPEFTLEWDNPMLFSVSAIHNNFQQQQQTTKCCCVEPERFLAQNICQIQSRISFGDFWASLLLSWGPWESRVINWGWASSSHLSAWQEEQKRPGNLSYSTGHNLGVAGSCSAEMTFLASVKLENGNVTELM